LALVLVAGGVTSTFGQGTVPAHREPPPRPVAVWPPGPLEVIAAFERPVTPEAAKSMIGRTIAYEDIRGDRPEPPAAPRPAGRLRIVGARLVDDGRTLVLATDPHPWPARYLLPLPGDREPAASKGLPISTVPYDLSGAEAVWYEGEIPAGEPKWSGWWPSLDLDFTRRLTRGSRLHEAGLPLLDRSGRLVLSSWVRLPSGKVTLRVQSARPIEEGMLGDAQAVGHPAELDGIFEIELTVESRGEPLFLTTTLRTGDPGGRFQIKATYRVAAEADVYPIERSHLLVPWAPTSSVAATAAPLAIPDLSGGDPERGRMIFRGDQARCAQCHAFRGDGGKVGPDLTDIASKGRAEIYRSIAAPSAAIEPDYTTYTVATKDGQVLSGVVRAEGPDEIRVTDTNARAATVRRDQIQEIRPSATSIMPPGLAGALGDSAMRDLVAYLTSPAPAANRASP
jgi:putative heme-binding domain-containing protein